MKKWIILDRLTDVILSNVEGCVVDVGIGKSTDVLYAHSSRLKRKHYSCDISEKLCRWARSLNELEVFEGKSFNFIKQFSDIPVAVVFIDGDHHYSTVIEEVNFFLSRLSPGGVIFLHDTLPRDWRDVHGYEKNGRHADLTCDSYLVRQEMEKRKDLQIFTWPYTAQNTGLTMIMKKEENAPRFRQ